MAYQDVYDNKKYGVAGVYANSEVGTAVQIASEGGPNLSSGITPGSFIALFPKGDSTPFAIAAPASGGLHIQYRGRDGIIRMLDLIEAVETLAALTDADEDPPRSLAISGLTKDSGGSFAEAEAVLRRIVSIVSRACWTPSVILVLVARMAWEAAVDLVSRLFKAKNA